MNVIGYRLKNINNYDEFETLWEKLFKNRKTLKEHKVVLVTKTPDECWKDLYFGIFLDDYLELAKETDRPRKLADYSENPIREVARQIEFDLLPLESYFEGDLTLVNVYDEKNILFDAEKQGEVEMKALVIINENHSLFPEQEAILRERFEEIEFVKVPASGWTLEEMRQVAYDLHKRIPWDGAYGSAIVFASPVPYLLRELTEMAISAEMGDDDVYTSNKYDVLVFHNDHREKKELPDGHITQTVAATGWKLV